MPKTAPVSPEPEASKVVRHRPYVVQTVRLQLHTSLTEAPDVPQMVRRWAEDRGLKTDSRFARKRGGGEDVSTVNIRVGATFAPSTEGSGVPRDLLAAARLKMVGLLESGVDPQTILDKLS